MAGQRAQEGTPAASSSGGGAPKTPWRTPPPTFAEVATPLTAVAASGWQQHYDDDTETGEGARLASIWKNGHKWPLLHLQTRARVGMSKQYTVVLENYNFW